MSPGRRVVSPGANGTLHFGSAAPRVASRKTSAPESKEPAFLERGGGGGGRDASPSSPSSRAGRASPSSPSSRRASLPRDVNVGPKKPKPRACVARRGVPVAAELARGPATFTREEKNPSVAHSRERGGLLGSGSPPSASMAVDGADVRESNRSDPGSVSSVSSLSRSLGSLGGLAGPKKKELARTDTSAFAVVKKKSRRAGSFAFGGDRTRARARRRSSSFGAGGRPRRESRAEERAHDESPGGAVAVRRRERGVARSRG